MNGLELAVLIGSVILLGGYLAGRLRINPSLALLVLGAALGFVPALGDIELPPEVVLLLFLPAILYWESLNTSAELRRNARVILIQAVPLVLVTAAAVAALGYAFGLPLPVAIAFGAILAPTDATAVAAIAKSLPRRSLTILRGESLINDGTALALYGVAVAAAVAEREFNIGEGSFRFLLAYAGGIVIGIVGAIVITGLRRLVRPHRLLENTISVLTPFVVYLPAELLDVSGVVAVVVCGLTLSQIGPRYVSAATRNQASGFWQLASYLLNGSLFVLVGFQLHAAVDDIGAGWPDALALGLLATLVVIVVRLGFNNTTPYLIRAIDRRPIQRTRRVGFRQRFPLAWAGFRGAVSLAAALALPEVTDTGAPFPGRDLIIAATVVVIFVTLVLLGSTMPAVVRWGRLPEDPTERDEERLAHRTGLQAALDVLEEAADRLETPDDIRSSLRHEYQDRLGAFSDNEDEADDAERARRTADSEAALRLALVSAKRAAIVRLRDQNDIDDTVLRRVQQRLDLEELRLSEMQEDG